MNSPTFLRQVAAIGLPLVVIGSIILAISYINDQQTLRALANEPQEYIVRDAVLRVQVANALPTGGFEQAIPIEHDPAAYVVFYDATGTPVTGTGIVNGQAPTLPQGVLEVAKQKGVNRLTWEPAPGIRQAIVVLPAGPGYVMAGRSLAYTEEKEHDLTRRALLGWVGMMIAAVGVALISSWLLRRNRELTNS